MSNIIEFRKVLTLADMVNGVATLDGSTNIEPKLQLPLHGTIKMQVNAITISDRIPNFFNASPHYTFDNTIVRLTTNNYPAVPAYDCVIPRGLYNTVDQVAAAINSAINDNVDWWTSKTDPGLKIIANSIIDKVIIIIDSSKLKPAIGNSFRFDMRNSTTGTMMAYTLGFTEGSAYLVGAVGSVSQFSSNQEVRMDTQGNTCDIQSTLISVRRRNDTQVRTLALVPFAGKNTLSDNIWPSDGQVSPVLVYEGNRSIGYWTIQVKTLDNLPMLFMGGVIHVVVTFLY